MLGLLVLTSSLSTARTKALLSLVHDRTVSVLPSLNKRVIEASYVKQNVPRSWDVEKKNTYMQIFATILCQDNIFCVSVHLFLIKLYIDL